jgi:soluble lytic murein transglycosylase
VSSRTSTSRARSHSRSSAKRSKARRASAAQKRRRKSGRRRRSGVILTVALIGVIAGVAVLNRDQIGDTLGDPILELTLPLRHEDIIRQQAEEKDVPADLIAAVIYAESRFRDQESHAGARGLMQVTPQTAELIESLSGGSTFQADDLSDPDINIRYGTFYLRYLLDKFDDNLTAALAAYNGGETNVAAWGGADLEEEDIEFEETRNYVDKVMDKREEYREKYSDELGID